MSLNKQLNHLYDQYARDIKKYSIFMTRDDGTNVFTNRESEQESTLVVAAWQAICTVSPIDNFKTSDFRLSFETSSQGIHVLCFEFTDHRYFASIIYEDTLNPALLKKKFREFIANISNNLKEVNSIKSEVKVRRDDFLFQDFSDKELDSVFSQLRGQHVIC